MIVAALLFGGWALLPDAAGEQVRRRCAELLRQHYPHLGISIERGRYDPSTGIILSGIEVRDPYQPIGTRPLVRIERLVARTQVDLEQLVAGELPLMPERLHLSGVEVNVWPTQEGGWSIDSLGPLPEFGPAIPEISVSHCRIRLLKDARPSTAGLELRDVAAEIRQRGSHPLDRRTDVVLRGTGGFVDAFTTRWVIAEGRLQATGRARRLRLGHDVIERLPAPLTEPLCQLAGLQLVAGVDWQCQRDVAGLWQSWGVRAEIEEGRFSSADLPLPVEQLAGTVVLGPQGVQMTQVSGTLAGARCRIEGRLHGLTWPCPLELQIQADDLLLDDRLAEALPPRERALWDRVRPSGRINLAAQVSGRPQQWQMRADVDCKGLDVCFDRFPYPVRSIAGHVRYENGIASAERMVGRAGSRLLEFSFQAVEEGVPVEEWVRLRTDGPLTMDETLISSLTPRGEAMTSLEAFVRSLAVSGNVHVARAELEETADGKTSRLIDLRVSGARIRYDEFPYPLDDIRGQILVVDDSVRLVDFRGKNNDTATIQCTGFWRQVEGAAHDVLDLRLLGSTIPLDEGLRGALPEDAQQSWDTLGPSGVLDRLEVHIGTGPAGPPRLAIFANHTAPPGSRRTVSLTPIAFPYRLDIARGNVRLEEGRIHIDELDAYHDTSRLAAEGACVRGPDDRWSLDLNVLTGSRLRPDAELIAALPDDIRGSVNRLQLREPVSVRGTTRIVFPTAEDSQPEFGWDVSLQMEGNRIGDSGGVHDIRGELTTRGYRTRRGTTADGTVRIDSMHVRDLQLTRIEGPFSVRGNTLLLGQPRRLPGGRDRIAPIRCLVFGGTLDLDGEVALESGQFEVDLELTEADIPTALAELQPTQSNMTGTFSGRANLRGTLGAPQLLEGSGRAELSGANLYQLPLIVQLFSQLRLTPSEEAAFSDGEMEFQLFGEKVTFTQLQLMGDIVALQGSGTLNARRELDLRFNTRVSPQNVWSQLVRPLGGTRYTLWTLSVRGPISDPVIERRALDGVGETLERIFPAMERKGREERLEQAARPRWRQWFN